ncbi:MAG: hypothetical protein A3G34_01180 [Candidatus Lindowbacteria bacterium RIFCSPLOWO2_12_FULL_62_27]|nr:MAG: hypothetical protein A3G34_01180 [Candidatus Lindowbacteria bacterium RIFCSPLOWO2_12_FULL_62_27]OGH63684.1 MAG: hypothetical protein A3I06_07630 [Candidatus Lindowbacteria bacterium RIFCSPLOWO2_02_FULL_62_12]
MFVTLLLTLATILCIAAVLTLTFFVRSNFSLAMKKITAGKPQEAMDLLKRVVGWQEKHVPSLWQLALLNLSTDKSDAAIRYLEKIVKIMAAEPDKAGAVERWEVTEAQVLSKLAWSLSKINKRAEAVTAFKRLIELEPKNKEARFELSKLLYAVRDYDQCIPMLESVIDLDPAHTEAMETLSHAYSAKGQHARAAEVLARRLESDRKNVNLWIRLANLHRTARNNEKQVEAWTVVTEITSELDPNHVSATVQLGKLSYLEGQYDDAIQKLKKAETICPLEDGRTLKSVKYYLGRAYLELDRKDEARTSFSEVYNLDRNYKDVRDLLRESYELLSDDDLADEVNRMRMDDFADLVCKITKHLGYKISTVQTVSDIDVKIDARLEETGKDRIVLLYFQRGAAIDVGELTIRSFFIECEEKHVEYPLYFTTGGFSFEAQIKAKNSRLSIYPRRDFCEYIRKVRMAV